MECREGDCFYLRRIDKGEGHLSWRCIVGGTARVYSCNNRIESDLYPLYFPTQPCWRTEEQAEEDKIVNRGW